MGRKQRRKNRKQRGGGPPRKTVTEIITGRPARAMVGPPDMPDLGIDDPNLDLLLYGQLLEGKGPWPEGPKSKPRSTCMKDRKRWRYEPQNDSFWHDLLRD